MYVTGADYYCIHTDQHELASKLLNPHSESKVQNNDFQVSVPNDCTLSNLSGHFMDFVLAYNDIMFLCHFLLAGQKGRICTHLCGHFKEMY